MTAMNLVVEERILERRSSLVAGSGNWLRDLRGEVVQVLAGGLMPLAGPAPELRTPLRRDLGLD